MFNYNSIGTAIKRFFCTIVLLNLISHTVFSETPLREKDHFPRLSVGSNLLYLAALAPNVAAEYYFQDSHLSVSATFTMPWWKRKSKHQFYQIRQYLAEGRYWLNKIPSAKGHFFGCNIHGGIYDLENKKTGYYGDFIGTSLTYGYRFSLNKKMALELTVGGGYIFSKYDKYVPADKCYMYQSTHKAHYWGITKAGVSLMWNIL